LKTDRSNRVPVPQHRHRERASHAESAHARVTRLRYPDRFHVGDVRLHRRPERRAGVCHLIGLPSADGLAVWGLGVNLSPAAWLFFGQRKALSGAAVNRYRDRLSGLFKRALRLSLVERNPVTGIPKHKEPGGRIVYLTGEEEAAIGDALPGSLRPML